MSANQKILNTIDQKLEETQTQLDEGEAALQSAKAQLNHESSKQIGKLTQAETQLAQGKKQIQQALDALPAALLGASPG